MKEKITIFDNNNKLIAKKGDKFLEICELPCNLKEIIIKIENLN